jgi:hypothetical protein
VIVGDGRPLRFLALVAGGWIALRVGMAWHATGSLPDALREALPMPAPAVAALSPVIPVTPRSAGPRWPVTSPLMPRSVPGGIAGPPVADPVRVQLALLAMTRVMETASDTPLATGSTVTQGIPPMPAPGHAAAPSRWSVSSWLIARSGTGLGTTPLSPQLGGTQGGVRIDYALTRGIAATARVAAPAAGAGRELSLGVAWRPAGVPLRFVAEQRLALDRGRSGPALGVSGGVSDLVLPAGFRLEGYGQAGAILRDGVERYIDGSVRAARPVADLAGIALDLGGGAWGGAQRGVARLDVGPSVGARIPLGERRLRVSLDWRQRIAGNARPGSGPALTLGSDF